MRLAAARGRRRLLAPREPYLQQSDRATRCPIPICASACSARGAPAASVRWS
ncbi:MAG: hypothetical protein AVDCRST_MAG45-2204 [uncultured Solirubrobacterales bacterium]|uniref:Uncharacterized protein n=1 Tax=uncultured Solirubrobacterales bacterium TaxID=768556 RepID=A0A6J4T7B5_9ACTN|nr:MAG: hypothetical protein AVDCRST_MAG45-2204 [uncultured Solirubrobacterales bacterium]